MNVYAISDLHLSTSVDKPMDIFGKEWVDHFDVIKQDWMSRVSEDDVVLMPGDFSWAMRINEAASDFDLFKGMPGKKVILRGNHDYWWNTISVVRKNIPQGFFALQNDVLRFDDVLICGTRGWLCPDKAPLSEEDNKIFLREIERLKLSLAQMDKERAQDDKVICIMHFPPFNSRYEPSEFVKLMIEHNIPTVVYGHLHGANSRAELYVRKFNIDFYLTSSDLVSNHLVQIL